MSIIAAGHITFSTQPAFEDRLVAHISPHLDELQSSAGYKLLVLGLRPLLGVQACEDLKVQPARRRVSPVGEQRLGRFPFVLVTTFVAVRCCCGSVTHNPVGGTDDMFADQQLAVPCHGGGRVAEDLDRLCVGPVVDYVTQEIDICVLDRGGLEKVQVDELCVAELEDVRVVFFQILQGCFISFHRTQVEKRYTVPS